MRQPGAGGDDVVPRHPLLAEAATTVLGDDPDEVRHLAAVLAERARSARRLPLAARALALAGDRDGALACAVEAAGAADRPGDSAALLQLAAEFAPPELVAELTVRAVEQLVTAGEFVRAAPLVDRLPGRADAHWNVLVGRVWWEKGDDDAAVRA